MHRLAGLKINNLADETVLECNSVDMVVICVSVVSDDLGWCNTWISGSRMWHICVV